MWWVGRYGTKRNEGDLSRPFGQTMANRGAISSFSEKELPQNGQIGVGWSSRPTDREGRSMMRWPRRVLAVSLSALLLLGTSEVAADASAVPRISRVATVAQKSSCASGLKVHWHRVRGASYEVRWARSKAGLGQATPVAVGRTRTVLPVTGKSFVQVRAVRGGRTGAWSRPSVGRVGAGSRVSSKLAKPALSGFGLPGGVQFTWGCTSGNSPSTPASRNATSRPSGTPRRTGCGAWCCAAASGWRPSGSSGSTRPWWTSGR